jgi:hypothetical protein
MTVQELWNPDEKLGKPTRVGQWLYDGRISLAVRLFESDILYGSGDEEDPPELREDQFLKCYYLDLQVGGEGRWGSRHVFQTLNDVERFGRNELGDSLEWS